MEEIFTWKEVSDPSLRHLYYAIQHGADVPVFVSRYLLPCGVGVAIILADFADARGADSQASSRLVWGSIIWLLLISPVATVLALPPLPVSPQYLDVQRLDRAACQLAFKFSAKRPTTNCAERAAGLYRLIELFSTNERALVTKSSSGIPP
jgi:hypothetical protein